MRLAWQFATEFGDLKAHIREHAPGGRRASTHREARMARADSFAKKMPSIPGFEDEATWSGYPGQIQPRGPKSAIASRKDINLGYEHRWTPDTMHEAFSTSMNAQPRDLLQMNHAHRHVAPAGIRKQRGVSSLDVGYHSFGTSNGQLLSEMPAAKAVRNAYHYESPTADKLQSPTSAVLSPSDLLPRAAREDRTLTSSGVGGSAGAVGGERKAPFAQPSWQQINPAYRTDWV